MPSVVWFELGHRRRTITIELGLDWTNVGGTKGQILIWSGHVSLVNLLFRLPRAHAERTIKSDLRSNNNNVLSGTINIPSQWTEEWSCSIRSFSFTIPFFAVIPNRWCWSSNVSIKKLCATQSETTNSRVRLAFDRRRAHRRKKNDESGKGTSGSSMEEKQWTSSSTHRKKCEKFSIQRCF